MKTTKLLMLFALLALGATTQLNAQFSVLVCGADGNALNRQDVDDKLTATGLFSNVDNLNVSSVTPTLATLQSYNAILIYSLDGYSAAAATAMGNVVAQYVDAGGGVVLGAFENHNSSTFRMLGSFDNSTYRIISPASAQAGTSGTLGTVLPPLHFVMTGVSSFSGGDRINSTALYPGSTGAYKIANWSAGQILVAARDNAGSAGNKKRVDVNFLPPSGTVNSGYWNTSTDGAKLLANALLYVGCSGPVITSSVPLQFCGSVGTATLTASAGSAYLWSTSETTQSISVSAVGTYSVTVDGVPACDVATVIVKPMPTITPGGPTTFCTGGSVVLTASAPGPWMWNNFATTQSITVTTSVTRTVSVNGCVSAPVTVTVNALPGTFTASSNSPIYCSGNTLNLFATTSSGAVSYSWTGPNGFTSTAQNPTIPNVTSAASGTYTVTATTASGCTRTATTSVSVFAATLSGTYSVGVGGDFPTLKDAVFVYNTSCLTGAVIFELIQATYTTPSETFPISINGNPTASSVNTLTIRPATGVTPLITGTSLTSILKFNGADFVTIDGSNSGGTDRSLTIRNTNTSIATNSTAIWVSSLGVGLGANNNTIKNCNIFAGTNSGSGITFAIYSDGTSISATGTGADNDNLTIQNNQLGKSQYGIYVSGTSANKTDGLSIVSNTIGSSVTVDRIAVSGIQVAQVNNFTIAQNEILHMGGSTTPTGILLSTGSTNGTVLRNNIHDIISTGGASGGKGIDISGGNNLTVANNFINNISGPGGPPGSSIVGIRINSSAGVNVDFNTVNLTGSISRTTSTDVSAALGIGGFATALNIRNNILVNTLVNTTGVAKAYAIYSGVSNFTTINHNDYYAAGPEGILGFFVSDKVTLASWQAVTSQDVNSVNVAPVFESATDLHLVAAVNPLLNGGATPIAGITDDYDGATRNATTPDIGADEGCDDGLFCNGVEIYTSLTGCVAGTPPSLDDGIACTADACDEANDLVTHTPTFCDDGLFCNGVETCSPSGCVAGTPTSTDDGIACTDDACDEANDQITHTANNALCDDGLFCNGVESCNPSTGCVAGTPPSTDDGIACTDDACDEANDQITHTANNALCDDADACTDDACNPLTGCVYTPVVCDDGDACTDDACNPSTGCVYTAHNCDDGNACTDDACNPSTGCVYTAHTCDDGDACTDDACNPLTGCVYTAHNCDDADACTDDTCNPSTGCAYTAHNCDDGDACTDDACNPSTGCAYTAHNCDDGDACTDDACNPSTGCVYTAHNCDDGDACTDDACNPSTGCVYTAHTCDDGDACTDDACNPSTGCVYTAHNCDDGDACTDDTCNPSTGCAYTAHNCDDGDACTDDACNPSTGCAYTAHNCDDGDACTDDACNPSTGCVYTAHNCDDGDACTDDACNPSTGCVYTVHNCDDGDACADDACNPSTGCAYTAHNCDDGNACTDDACNPSTGCAYTAHNCGDGNACTDDACNPLTGCVYTTHGCSDGLFCNGVESCNPSTGCVAGTPPSTDDGSFCTVDACDEATDQITHTLSNAVPVVTSLILIPTASIIPVNSSTTLSVTFTDNANGGPYTVDIDWNDGTSHTFINVPSSAATSYTVSALHTYNVSAVYELKVRVTDGCGAISAIVQGTSTFQYLAVYVTGNNFTTEGGWFNAPSGSYMADLTFNGRVNMGNVCKPSNPGNKGELELHINAKNFYVRSVSPTAWDYLTITECCLAIFKGTVTINNAGSYKILVAQTDKNYSCNAYGGNNKVRIKIWNPANGQVFFDTQPGAPDNAPPVLSLNGGAIQVHSQTTCTPASKMDEEEGKGKVGLTAYPNPFSDKLSIEFTLQEDSHAKIEIFNISGQKLATVFEGSVKASALNKAEFNPGIMPGGIIIYRLRTEKDIYYGRAVMVR